MSAIGIKAKSAVRKFKRNKLLFKSLRRQEKKARLPSSIVFLYSTVPLYIVVSAYDRIQWLKWFFDNKSNLRIKFQLTSSHALLSWGSIHYHCGSLKSSSLLRLSGSRSERKPIASGVTQTLPSTARLSTTST